MSVPYLAHARGSLARVLIVAVVGPTGTGKSDLAIEIALEGRSDGAPVGEIVNADAFSLYRGLDIGTAKVLAAARRGVTHHQLDVLGPDEDASVAAFQSEARADLSQILERGARPVVAGGSGLYVRALLDRIEFPGTDPLVRERIEARAGIVGPRILHDELTLLDPVAAGNIGPGNTKRIVRALEVIELTGAPFSANLPVQEYVRPSLQIGLDHDRDALDERIAARVNAMWEAGLVDEVRALSTAEAGLGRTAARAVGYAEVLRFLGGELTEDEARELVIRNTRRLTRKQMGWFGRDARVHWLPASAPDLITRALDLIARAESGELTDSAGERPTTRALVTQF